MTLDKIPGTNLFSQRDVRETAGIVGIPAIADYTSAQHNHSDAAAGGAISHTDLSNIGTKTHAQIDTHVGGDGSDHADVATNSAHTAGDGSDHADVATNTAAIASINGGNVTSAVAGDGIDVSSATGAVTISAEDSTAGNKGIVIVAPGEGMDVSYASGTATVAGEDATTANKGIASFDSDHFSVAGGAVTSDISAGEGIDVSATLVVSGEDATVSNKGISSFASGAFAVSSGNVKLNSRSAAGTVNCNASGLATINFGTPFGLIPSCGASILGDDGFVSLTGIGTTQVTFKALDDAGATISGATLYWWAVGRWDS